VTRLAVLLLHRRGRAAGHRHVGLEVLRQAGRVRLPETAEDLQDPDFFMAAESISLPFRVQNRFIVYLPGRVLSVILISRL
jgi:hypothetical protein